MHAAGESSPGNLPEGTYAVVLGVPNEDALRSVAARVRGAGLACTEIVESDEPHAGQLMAVGLVPVPRSQGRKILSSLPLYRGPKNFAGGPQAAGSEPAPAPIRGSSSVKEHSQERSVV